MTKPSMQVVKGRVKSASQKLIETRGSDANGGTTTYDSQSIALRLDGQPLALMLNTTKAADIFVGHDDELDVACLPFADRLEIYGIRNRTDGSVYLARTAHVASARWERLGFAIMLPTALIAALIGHFNGVGRVESLWVFLGLGLGFPALVRLVSAIARLFGFVAMPEARGHAQPGGHREMRAAREALAITQDEQDRIRFV